MCSVTLREFVRTISVCAAIKRWVPPQIPQNKSFPCLMFWVVHIIYNYIIGTRGACVEFPDRNLTMFSSRLYLLTMTMCFHFLHCGGVVVPMCIKFNIITLCCIPFAIRSIYAYSAVLFDFVLRKKIIKKYEQISSSVRFNIYFVAWKQLLDAFAE